jgi:hypothetical protein
VFINTTTDKRLRINGDNAGEYLYFVSRGYYQNGVFTGGAANASLWAGTVYDTDGHFIFLPVGGKGGYEQGIPRAWGLPVRCIQQ